jgi:fatty acid-binding protein DegV
MPILPKVAIVVDSVASLPSGFSERQGIFVVAMTVTIDGAFYRDGIEITTDEFYRRIRNTSALAS